MRLTQVQCNLVSACRLMAQPRDPDLRVGAAESLLCGGLLFKWNEASLLPDYMLCYGRHTGGHIYYKVEK